MKLYIETEQYKLYEGSMLDMLDVIQENSIDAIVTDPPYELNFMNKGWDRSGIAFQKETWEKCLKVLKPGGYLLSFGGSRTFHRIACAIEDAGFEIRDTIMWLVGSGFPKSLNIGLSIDKKLGVDSEVIGHSTNGSGAQPNKLNNHGYGDTGIGYADGSGKEFELKQPTSKEAQPWIGWGTALKPAFESITVARKPCEGSTTDNVLKYGVGGINIDECRVPVSQEDVDMINAKASKNPTDNYNHNDTKKYGDYALNIATPANDGGRFPANVILTYDDYDFDVVCGGFPNTKSTGGSGEASKIHTFSNTYNGGWGHNKNCANLGGLGDEGSAARYFYCAKASKLDRDEGLDGRCLDSIEIILYNDTSGELLWKDSITIQEENKVQHLMDMEISLQKAIDEYGIQKRNDTDLNMFLYGKNILEKCLKECKYTTKMGISSTTIFQILNLLTHCNTNENTLDVSCEMEYGGNPVNIVASTNQLQITMSGKLGSVPGVKNVVLSVLWKINEKDMRNTHCTVKPTSLMTYLVRLVSPKGSTILDPFNGSGSTGKAVTFENRSRGANYKYIGIDLSEEYLQISKARIDYAMVADMTIEEDGAVKLSKPDKTKPKTFNLFDT